MGYDIGRFETQGPSWSERASLGELDAVLATGSSDRKNLFLHHLTKFGAKKALKFIKRNQKMPSLVDFGCGTGRFVRFFGQRGFKVIGTEITPEMLAEARRFGLPEGTELYLTDGIVIPVPDQSVDMIWVCGVLKYSLFVHPYLEFVRQSDPAYPKIATEMFRVLKPGGRVVNLEMYINNVRADVFTIDFERAGFITEQVKILQRYGHRLERLFQNNYLPLKSMKFTAELCAAYRYRFDDPSRPLAGLRDYLFIWSKTKPSS